MAKYTEPYWLEINGAIEIDVNQDDFMENFLNWLEANGWVFAGYTAPAKENENDEDVMEDVYKIGVDWDKDDKEL